MGVSHLGHASRPEVVIVLIGYVRYFLPLFATATSRRSSYSLPRDVQVRRSLDMVLLLVQAYTIITLTNIGLIAYAQMAH